jgi:UDP-2,3-diacylglucosamine pyrophosphatase LpxH
MIAFSDIHLGWAICAGQHERWLQRLPAAVDDAELVLLNGDVIDGVRGSPRAADADLLHRLAGLVDQWRREGRRVVYLEGNHDRDLDASYPLRPQGWYHDFETHEGVRMRALHGHRFSAAAANWELYDRLGRGLLAAENRAYGRLPVLRSLYRMGPGWLVSAIGATECALARRMLAKTLETLTHTVDVVLHGHIHYGPGRGRAGRIATWRTGSWVSAGHLLTADRMFRYRNGRFERIGWLGRRWGAFDDGR